MVLFGKKDKEKEVCELCGKKIGLMRSKITSNVGDRIICYPCVLDGKLNIKCSECGKDFFDKTIHFGKLLTDSF